MPVTCWSTARATPSTKHPPHPRLPEFRRAGRFPGRSPLRCCEARPGQTAARRSGSRWPAPRRGAACLVSQRGLSGTKSSRTRKISDGKTPEPNIHRQPHSAFQPSTPWAARSTSMGSTLMSDLAEEVGHGLAVEHLPRGGQKLVDAAAIRLGQVAGCRKSRTSAGDSGLSSPATAVRRSSALARSRTRPRPGGPTRRAAR